MNELSEDEYVYIVREREFIRLKEHTYKIGKTTQEPNSRFASYPKGSKVIIFATVVNCTTIENMIKERFCELFIQKRDYGREYFYGDIKKMVNEFMNIVMSEENETSQSATPLDSDCVSHQFTELMIGTESKIQKEILVQNENCKTSSNSDKNTVFANLLRRMTGIDKIVIHSESPNLLEGKLRLYDSNKWALISKKYPLNTWICVMLGHDTVLWGRLSEQEQALFKHIFKFYIPDRNCFDEQTSIYQLLKEDHALISKILYTYIIRQKCYVKTSKAIVDKLTPNM